MRRFQDVWIVRAVWEITDTYNRCSVAQAAAALAYFLILTLFPLLLCLNYFIGLFHLDLWQLLTALEQLLPREVLLLVESYLGYASQKRSLAVFLAALFAILVSASAGLQAVFHTMDRICGRKPGKGLHRVFLSVALSALSLLAVYVSAAAVFMGDWFFHLLARHLPQPFPALSALSRIWMGLRYVVLFSFMLLLVLAVYWWGSPRAWRDWGLIASAGLTSGALVVCSAVFSWFIGMSARYSLVYGSLASLIVLQVWLYFCGNILLLGAIVGQVIRRRKTL